MKNSAKLGTWLLLCILALSVCVLPCTAAQSRQSSLENCREIVAVDLYAGPHLRSYPIGTQLTPQTEGLFLPDEVIGATACGGTWCQAEWFPERVDTSTPGRKLIPGRLILPEGYTAASEAVLSLLLPVFLYEPHGETADAIVRLDTDSVPRILIPKGALADSAASFQYMQNFNTVVGRTASDDVIFCTVEYDADSFQPESTGWKQLTGSVIPPEGIGILDGLRTYQLPYYVMEPEKIDLSFYEYIQADSLYFCWLYYAEEPEEFFLETAVNDGPWTRIAANDPDNHLFFMTGNQMKVDVNSQWAPGNSYFYRVCYRGEYSNVMEFTVTEAGYSAHDRGGDRDGGDRGEQTPPAIKQPAPPNTVGPPDQQTMGKIDTPASPFGGGSREDDSMHSSQANLHSSCCEEETPDRSVWSGRRLLQQREATNNGFFTFEKHRIRVQIPCGAAAFADLAEDSFVSMEIRPLSSSSFFLELALDGAVPRSVPQMNITMPYTPTVRGAVFQVTDQQGVLLATAQYSEREGVLSFTIQQTGTFKIREIETQEVFQANTGANEQTSTQPKTNAYAVLKDAKFWIAVLCVCSVLLLLAARRFRRRRRNV